MLSTMSGRGRLPAAQKPYTLTPKPPNSGLHDPKDRARQFLDNNRLKIKGLEMAKTENQMKIHT